MRNVHRRSGKSGLTSLTGNLKRRGNEREHKQREWRGWIFRLAHGVIHRAKASSRYRMVMVVGTFAIVDCDGTPTSCDCCDDLGGRLNAWDACDYVLAAMRTWNNLRG